MDYNLFPIFSKPVFSTSLEFNKNKILSIIKELKFRETYKKENISSASLSKNVLELKELKTLKKDILDKFNIYTKDVLKYKYNDFKITSSWFTKALKGQSSILHNHTNSMFSGVLYIQTKNNKASISFENHDIKSFNLKVSEHNIYNANTFIFDNSETSLLFFPSEVFHKIDTNETNVERISLAFNFIPTGKIGDEETDSYCEIY